MHTYVPSLLNLPPISYPIVSHVFSIMWMCAQSLSCIQLFATPWTVALQASLPMECPDKNTEVGCISYYKGSSQLEVLNPFLLIGRWILYH